MSARYVVTVGHVDVPDAVSTDAVSLEHAREIADDVLQDADISVEQRVGFYNDTRALTDEGGVVGPLPEGVVIAIEKAS